MSVGTRPAEPGRRERHHWLTDPNVRSTIFQTLAVVVIVGLVVMIVADTAANMDRLHVKLGLSFLWDNTGLDLSQTLIPYSTASTIAYGLFVGFLNTVLVAVLGNILALIIGVIVGISRLSSNFVISRLAAGYVEIVRNIPLLLQLFFWYFSIFVALPGPKQSLQPIPGWVFLNQRGLVLPSIAVSDATRTGIVAAFLVAVVASLVIRSWSKRRQVATGQTFPVGWASLALIVGLPLVAFLATGAGLALTPAKISAFNMSGGTTINPELMAMLAGISIYTASYIAEAVRGGILAVSHGQTEAAKALGLTGGQTLNLVVLPQALRVIIPPLTNQFLNLTKNSSLALAIGYPDLVYVGETVFSKGGHEMEVITIWMIVYLGTSLATSVFMNWYNRRMAIIER